jgi:hypothetical protein
MLITLLVTDDQSQSQHQTLTVKYPVRSLDMIGMTPYVTSMRYKFCDQFTLPPMTEVKGFKHPGDPLFESVTLKMGGVFESRQSFFSSSDELVSKCSMDCNKPFFKAWFEVS